MKKFISSLVLTTLLLSCICFAEGSAESITLSFNKATADAGITIPSASCATQMNNYIQIHGYGHVECKVTVDTSARYSMMLHYGTNTDGVILDVSVADIVQIDLDHGSVPPI